MRIVFLFVVQIILLAPLCEAQPLVFLESIKPTEKLYYKHLPNAGGESTGRTESWAEWVEGKEGVESYWVQHLFDRKDKVFSTTEIWYDYKAGRPLRSHQMEHRSDIEVTGVYGKYDLKSTIRHGKEKFDLKYKQGSYSITLEILLPYLQNKIERVKKKSLTFDVTIPSLVLALKKKSLPYSMGQLSMTARHKGSKVITLDNGKEVKGVVIFVEPGNWFLRTILPDNRKNFTFVYEEASPHRLLSFNDGDITTVLTKIEPLVNGKPAQNLLIQKADAIAVPATTENPN